MSMDDNKSILLYLLPSIRLKRFDASSSPNGGIISLKREFFLPSLNTNFFKIHRLVKCCSRALFLKNTLKKVFLSYINIRKYYFIIFEAWNIFFFFRKTICYTKGFWRILLVISYVVRYIKSRYRKSWL